MVIIILSSLLIISFAPAIDVSAEAVPSSYDISTQPYFPPIKNQGGQGSCAAWAITYYAFGYQEARRCNWTDAYTGNTTHLFAPSFTFNRVNHGFQFSDLDDNAGIITSLGVCIYSLMPYDVSNITFTGSAEAVENALTHIANDTHTIAFTAGAPYLAVSQVRDKISNNIPVAMAVYFTGFTNVHGLNGTPVGDNLISSNEYNFSKYVNHAICIVGYDDAYTYTNTADVGAFKCANSWGTNIGDGGYIWVSYSTFVGIGPQLMLQYMDVNQTAYTAPPMQQGGNGTTTTPDDGTNNTTPPEPTDGLPQNDDDNGTTPTPPPTNHTVDPLIANVSSQIMGWVGPIMMVCFISLIITVVMSVSYRRNG